MLARTKGLASLFLSHEIELNLFESLSLREPEQSEERGSNAKFGVSSLLGGSAFPGGSALLEDNALLFSLNNTARPRDGEAAGRRDEARVLERAAGGGIPWRKEQAGE
jgi:hypothetical protein